MKPAAVESPLVHGTVDGTGRLVEADARLEELNARAGGAIDAPLAVPQLATLARLAQRLRIPVARSVTVADGEDDADMWVRAQPDGSAVRLTISGWGYHPAGAPAADPRANCDFLSVDADWLWETDAALRLTFVSEQATARFAIAAPALLGQPVTRLFALSGVDQGNFPLLAAAANHGRFEDQHATVRGTNHAVLLSAMSRQDDEGRFAGFTGVARAVASVASPAAAPVADLVLPQAFSERLDRALRGPLGQIVAGADSINGQSDGTLRPEYAEYAADIATAGRHMIGLVDDLIDLQFVEQPNFTVTREDIDLADIARRAAGLLTARAQSNQVMIDLPATPDGLAATGEFRRALQILVNLIGNAVRYSPTGGTVWIRPERDGPSAAVIVADQGKGVAVADQDRIFDKFEQADPGESGGSGLGLYISRRLARAMGGDITVDSAPGQGARFVLKLPGR